MRRLIALLTLIALTACLQPAPEVAALPTLTASPASTLTSTAGPTESPTPEITPSTPPLPENLPTPGTGALGNPGNLASAASISYFAAAPAEVSPGEAATLFWSANGGGARIDEIDVLGGVTESWDVPLSGSLEVRPRLPGRDVRYRLLVESGLSTAEAEVLIGVRCALAWFFTPIPAEGCPDQEVSGSKASVQEFERGRMFWIESRDEIIVIFNGNASDFNDDLPAWIVFEDRYETGEPEAESGLTPPPGRYVPRQRFGKPWVDSADLRGRLGWARSEALDFNTLYQRESLGDVFGFYFSDNRGAVIWLEAGQLDWDEVAQRPGS